MPSITLQCHPLGHPIITCVIRRPLSVLAGEETKPLPLSVDFMVDTGACVTCIDRGVIAEANLPRFGTSKVCTNTSEEIFDCPNYLADLLLPVGERGQMFFDLAVDEFAFIDRTYKGLLGRDVLDRCALYMKGGWFTLEV